MATRKCDNHQGKTADFYTTMARLTRCVWALENAKDEIRKVLHAQHAHPGFHNLQCELANLDYFLRSLPLERDENGRPLHPQAIKMGAR